MPRDYKMKFLLSYTEDLDSMHRNIAEFLTTIPKFSTNFHITLQDDFKSICDIMINWKPPRPKNSVNEEISDASPLKFPRETRLEVLSRIVTMDHHELFKQSLLGFFDDKDTLSLMETMRGRHGLKWLLGM